MGSFAVRLDFTIAATSSTGSGRLPDSAPNCVATSSSAAAVVATAGSRVQAFVTTTHTSARAAAAATAAAISVNAGYVLRNSGCMRTNRNESEANRIAVAHVAP